MRAAAVAIGCFAVMLPAQPAALGQQMPNPSAKAGYDIAQRLCIACHVVGPDAPTPVPAGLATFRGIANHVGQTGQKILDALISPRHPMPDMQLSIEEIGNIIAFLETLRTDPTIAPLVGPTLPTHRQIPPSRS